MTKKISGLSAASALDGTEKVEVVQGGTSVRTTTQDIANLGGGGIDGTWWVWDSWGNSVAFTMDYDTHWFIPFDTAAVPTPPTRSWITIGANGELTLSPGIYYIAAYGAINSTDVPSAATMIFQINGIPEPTALLGNAYPFGIEAPGFSNGYTVKMFSGVYAIDADATFKVPMYAGAEESSTDAYAHMTIIRFGDVAA